MPCNDAYNNCKNETVLTEDYNHKSDHNDICSPLCSCTCCSISVNPKLTSFKIDLTKPIVSSKITFPIQDFSFVSNYYGNIWQPPKING